MQMPTRPPPPGRPKVTPQPRLVTGYHDCGHYKLPMSSQYRPAWVEVSAQAGLPLDVVVLDFESFFDTKDGYSMAGRSAKGLTTVEYIQDQRWETLGLASLHMDGRLPFSAVEPRTTWHEGETGVQGHISYLRKMFGSDLERCTVVAQNASFDLMVLALRYGVYPSNVIDLLGLSRAWNSRQHNDLKALCKQYGLPPKGETMDFDGLSNRTRFTRSKPGAKRRKPPVPRPTMSSEQASSLAVYAENDVLREWELFTIMLPRLSNPKIELRLMQHTLELFTRPQLGVDQVKAAEIVGKMNAEVERTLALTGNTHEEISGDTSFDRLVNVALEQAGDDCQKYYKFGKRGALLAIAKDDPERKLLEQHASERVRNLMAGRAAITSWPTHVQRIERIIRMACACAGVLPVPLKYHGAHTGRFSGGEKINLQNLGSRGHELVNAVREILVALGCDQRLVIVDLAAIEARVLAWIARQYDLVAKFANNEEIYCGFATKVLGWPVRKPKKSGGIPAIEAKMKWARNAIGKIGILGCGYGMGQDRIHEMGAGEFDLETALKIRDTYRSEHPAIPQFWKDIEKAFLFTAKYRQPCELPLGLKFFWSEECDVTITLPNGRELHYPSVKIVQDKYGEKLETYNELQHASEHLWGGTLTENVVQAVARDVLVEAMLRLEDAGKHTVLHVHDELVILEHKDAADETLKLAITEMSKTPTWAPGLPLGAEGLVTKAYGGH